MTARSWMTKLSQAGAEDGMKSQPGSVTPPWLRPQPGQCQQPPFFVILSPCSLAGSKKTCCFYSSQISRVRFLVHFIFSFQRFFPLLCYLETKRTVSFRFCTQACKHGFRLQSMHVMQHNALLISPENAPRFLFQQTPNSLGEVRSN